MVYLWNTVSIKGTFPGVPEQIDIPVSASSLVEFICFDSLACTGWSRNSSLVHVAVVHL